MIFSLCQKAVTWFLGWHCQQAAWRFITALQLPHTAGWAEVAEIHQSSCWYFHCHILYWMKHSVTEAVSDMFPCSGLTQQKDTCLWRKNLLELSPTTLLWTHNRILVWHLVNCILIVTMTCISQRWNNFSKVLELSNHLLNIIFNGFIGIHSCESAFISIFCAPLPSPVLHSPPPLSKLLPTLLI